MRLRVLIGLVSISFLLGCSASDGSSSSSSSATGSSGSSGSTGSSATGSSGSSGSTGSTGSTGSSATGSSGSSGSLTPVCAANDTQDGTETDVDCGGGCGPCALGQGCQGAPDCASLLCHAGQCDAQVMPFNLPLGYALSSLDSADGQSLYATASDWSILSSTDGARSWQVRYAPTAARSEGKARIHVGRADANQILVYAYTDTQTSTYDATLLVSHDGLAHVTPSQNGLNSWGDLGAFSLTDPNVVYFFGDNGDSRVSTNAGDTSTALDPNPDFHAGGLWTAGAAAVDPLDSTRAWVSMAGSDAPPLTSFGAYQGSTGGVTDLTSIVTAALAGQSPGGFEVYATGTGTYRLRLVGLEGAIATSDDEGATFQSFSASAALPLCGSWAGKVRQLVSQPGHPDVVASWCPKTSDLAFSVNGGASWTPVAGPSWQRLGCTSISGVVVTAHQLVVACAQGPSGTVGTDPADVLPDGGALSPACSDGVQDGDESGLDCGGSCLGCDLGEVCHLPADCASGACGPGSTGSAGVCAPATCTDGLRDGSEVGVDCGAPGCEGCPVATACRSAFECASGICQTDGTCSAPSCTDGVKNGTETDLDCGGSCGPCTAGAGCAIPGDCTSGLCTDGLCDVGLTALSVPDAGAAFSSIDTADGVHLFATLPDWTVVGSGDSGQSWTVRHVPAAARSEGKARIHVGRADANQILVYAYTDTQTSTYDANVFVSHNGMTTAAELTDGVSSWGDLGAFSLTDPNVVYFFGDNAASRVSTNAGDTSTALDPNPDFHAGGLWTAGAAAVDPLDSTRAWVSMAGSDAPPLTSFGAYQASTGGVTDLTSIVTTALAGQSPGGFEVYATGTGTYRLRLVGLEGAIATSDDEGATFQSFSSSAALPLCGNWADKVRQLVSQPGHPDVVASWCPKTSDLAFSVNGGASWSRVSQAPAWATQGCSVITGVVLTGTGVVVACGNGASVRFAF